MDDPDKDKYEVSPEKEPSPKQKKDTDKITNAMRNTILSELKRTGLQMDIVLKTCKIKKLEEMDMDQYKTTMNKFKVTPDKGGATNE